MCGGGKRVRKSLPTQCIPSCFGECKCHYFNPGSMVFKERLAWGIVGIPSQAVLWFPQISPHEPTFILSGNGQMVVGLLPTLKGVTSGDGVSWSGQVSSPGMWARVERSSGALGFSWHSHRTHLFQVALQMSALAIFDVLRGWGHRKSITTVFSLPQGSMADLGAVLLYQPRHLRLSAEPIGHPFPLPRLPLFDTRNL